MRAGRRAATHAATGSEGRRAGRDEGHDQETGVADQVPRRDRIIGRLAEAPAADEHAAADRIREEDREAHQHDGGDQSTDAGPGDEHNRGDDLDEGDDPDRDRRCREAEAAEAELSSARENGADSTGRTRQIEERFAGALEKAAARIEGLVLAIQSDTGPQAGRSDPADEPA